MNGTDVTDVPIEFTGNEQVSAVLTDRAASISGRVLDTGGKAVAGAAVVLIATEKSLWGPHFTTSRKAASGPDGTYAIGGLSGREYLLAAFPEAEVPSLSTADAAFYELVAEVGGRIRLNEAQQVAQDLVLSESVTGGASTRRR